MSPAASLAFALDFGEFGAPPGVLGASGAGVVAAAVLAMGAGALAVGSGVPASSGADSVLATAVTVGLAVAVAAVVSTATVAAALGRFTGARSAPPRIANNPAVAIAAAPALPSAHNIHPRGEGEGSAAFSY